MLIKSIELNNFRQFKGKQKLTFSCNPEKNVTVLLGDNTFGKTTILQAFNWCLYGKAVFPKEDNPDFLLNYEVAYENTGMQKTSNVYVEILLVHKDCEYTIRRTQEYLNSSNNNWKGLPAEIEITWKDNGIAKTVKPGEERKTINSILPESLSEYFFFDTERVSDIGTKKDLPEAVKGLLGLAPVKNARDHLGKSTLKSTVIGKWYNSLDENGDERAKTAKITIEENSEKKANLENERKNSKDEIERLKEQKAKIDQIIRENQDTAELQQKKDSCERKLEEYKEELNNLNLLFKEYFSDNIINYFSIPLIEKAEEFLKDAKVDDKGIRDMTATAIMDIIARGRCICGSEIIKGSDSKDGNEAYKHIMQELKYLPPEHIGTTIKNYKNLLETDKEKTKLFFKCLEQQYKEIIRIRGNISECEDTIKEIEDNISDKFVIEDYEQQVEDIKKLIKNMDYKISETDKKIGVCEKEIESAQKTIDSLIASSSANDKLIKCIAYAQNICDWIDDEYGKKEIEIKEKLQEKVNEMLAKMYHGTRRVVIQDDYKVTLYSDVNGTELVTGESEGLKRVKNFAFISGLVDLAKEKVSLGNNKNAISWNNESYPLVMDAPFSNADETHIKNISKVLPDVANQVIMFVMKKDWQYAKEVMQIRVGKECTLLQKTEQYTEIQ